MWKRFCDLCGQPLDTIEGEYKIKKRWYAGPDSGWERIDAHEACIKQLLERSKKHDKRAS